MKFHLTLKSTNRKTGKIPVSTSPKQTCPSSCPFKNNGCYANCGPLNIHWNKISNDLRGDTWGQFVRAVKSIPSSQVWRHNQAGDLLGHVSSRRTINFTALKQLVAANKSKKGFTYTHYPVDGKSKAALLNRKAIEFANRNGFTINLSADNLNHADKLQALGAAPVTTLLATGTEGKQVLTPAGNKVLICPATYKDEMSCEKCRLCANANRKHIIGFPAHGSFKKHINKMLKEEANG